MDCLFCKIAAGEIPSECLYDGVGVFAFNDINPQAPTHFLVVPKPHIPSLNNVSPENSLAVARCLETIVKIAKDKGLSEDGYRVVVNCGENAGQTVNHLHFHVLGGEKFGEKMV